MEGIGGFFGMELHKGASEYHCTPYVMKSGRASLFCILTFLSPTLVYIPYYTCDALIEPFKAAGIAFKYYSIDAFLEPESAIEIKDGEYLLYINYFGLKDKMVASLSEKYGDRLIVDCTQAFFMKGNGVSWFFNSCRKFFGVPDGSYMYTPNGIAISRIEERNDFFLVDHLLKRFNGYAREGYFYFMQNENMAGTGVLKISKLSEYLLSNIDYNAVIDRRHDNYTYLRNRFESANLLKWLGNDCVPMYYPLMLEKVPDREILASRNIFIPSFWKDTLFRNMSGFEFEKSLAENILPLPVDHRYSVSDMEFICESIFNISNSND